jgi:hypothetical protein
MQPATAGSYGRNRIVRGLRNHGLQVGHEQLSTVSSKLTHDVGNV